MHLYSGECEKELISDENEVCGLTAIMPMILRKPEILNG